MISTKDTRPIAEAYPAFSLPKYVLCTNVDREWVSYPGPPDVSAIIMSNSFRPPIRLIVTEEDLLYKVYLDDTYGNYVKFNVLNVYYKSFKLSEGVYQHFGENNYIVYNNNQRKSYG